MCCQLEGPESGSRVVSCRPLKFSLAPKKHLQPGVVWKMQEAGFPAQEELCEAKIEIV